MKFVIQRVTNADVVIDGEVRGEIGLGFLVLIGVGADDNEQIAEKLVRKMLGLRIFADESGKTNLALSDVGGELLLVSQFTLLADCKKGYRPSFLGAGSPEHAENIYNYIVSLCRREKPDMKIATGEFGADMKVSLTNDGPFTIVLDSRDL